MKITFSLFAVLISTISILSIGCKQGQPAKTTVKQLQKVKAAVKKPHINDTLIFNDPALSALVQKTERLFSVFGTISPLSQYDITKLNLDTGELNAIRSSSDDSVNSVNGFSITGVLSEEISDNLLNILNWENIDNYDLGLLLKNHLGITKSPDGRLYNFTFDEKTGGTYHSQISIIHYNSGNGNRSKTFLTSNDGGGTVFNKDGYNSIDTINTPKGIKYVLTGSVVGCTTCFGNYIDLVFYRKDDFVNEFNYNTDTRSDWSDDDGTAIIAYDVKSHHININYVTDDLTPTCNCGKNGTLKDDEINTGEFDETSKERVNCVYAFNGRSFVLKKRKIKAVK